ncbi:MAG: class I SAM-dependent methyltransferase [Actinomycetota bacterium]|nr:class I SAM-dependent methyltransferase [Actinomycetota bacterium]
MAREGEHIGEQFDADVNLSRAVWCTIRHLRPARVVETGVARGVTSWVILEALAMNGTGHLWSIDLPNLAWAFDAGDAIPTRLRPHWTYLRGASTRVLPRLVHELGEIDVFIHDSLHTERNVRFELETAWPAVTAGGLMIVDDIDDAAAFGAGRAFTSFVCDRTPPHWLVGPQDEKPGCFGVIAKTAVPVRE